MNKIFFLITVLIGSVFSFNVCADQHDQIVVFDFGNVIGHTKKEVFTGFIAKSFRIPVEQTREIFVRMNDSFEQGIPESQFWHDIAKEKGVELPADWMEQWEKVKEKSLVLIPGMIDLVKDLQAKGYRTGMLSNVTKYKAAIIRKLGYYDYFNPCVLSYEVGLEKPDPRIYHLLIKEVGLPAKDIIFIDDKQENIDAANALGIDGILFVSHDQLVADLKERLKVKV